MRQVFVNQDHARVGFYKSVLDDAGIPNFVRNNYSNNSVADMPSPIFFPALCVVRDEDYDRAMQILAEIYYAPPSKAADWQCAHCGEESPGTFDSCWHCGALRADSGTKPNEAENA